MTGPYRLSRKSSLCVRSSRARNFGKHVVVEFLSPFRELWLGTVAALAPAVFPKANERVIIEL